MSALASFLRDEMVISEPRHHLQQGDATQTDAVPNTSDMEKSIPNKTAAFDPRQNPDGGLKAWLCVLGGFCCLFCSFGWINCVGVFQDYYQTHQLVRYSASTISWISSLETFILSQGICSSIGASMVFYPAISTIPTWFFNRRAFAFGIMAAGSSVGGVILPIMIERLIPEVGFPWAMRIAAFLIFFMLIVANLTVTSRAPPRRTPLDILDLVRPFQELSFDLLTFGAFLFFFGMNLPINYIITEALTRHMSPQFAQYLVSILNAGSLFGRTVPGYLADKIGRFNMIIIMCCFTGIIILGLWLPATGNVGIIIFAALFGFGSGAFVSLAPSCVAHISDVRKIGVRTGVMFCTISIASLISNPIGGQIIARWNGSYIGLQIFAGVMCLAGTLFLIFARIRIAGLKIVKMA